jgi:hypothetical protein
MGFRGDVTQHAVSFCPHRRTKCSHCPKLVPPAAIAAHEQACPHAPAPCPNAECGVTATKGTMASHRAECPRELVVCPRHGCAEKMLRAALAEHDAASTARHLLLAEEALAREHATVQALKLVLGGAAGPAGVKDLSRCEGVELRLWVGSLDDYAGHSEAFSRELNFSTAAHAPTGRLKIEVAGDAPDIKFGFFFLGGKANVDLFILNKEGGVLLRMTDHMLRGLSHHSIIPWFFPTEEQKAQMVHPDGTIRARALLSYADAAP